MRSEESVASTGQQCKLPGGFSQANEMGDFRVTFLGTGTSQGVPMIACDCPVLRVRRPARPAHPRLALRRDAGGRLSSWTRAPISAPNACASGVRRLDAVVYTHSHTDHIMGFDDLRRFSDLLPDHILPVYASPETMADLQRVFRFAFDGSARFPRLHPPRAASGGGAVSHRRNGDHAAAGAARADVGERLPVRAGRPEALRLPERLQGGARRRCGRSSPGSRSSPSMPSGTDRTRPT